MMATEDVQVQIKVDGLSDLRHANRLLKEIEARIERLAARSEELGVPLRLLLEREA